MRKEPEGLGVSYFWKLPDSHPFHVPAVEHDRAYDNMKEPTSKIVDDIFLRRCLCIAGSNKKLIAQAYLFYSLARVWGIWKWKQGSKLGQPIFKTLFEKV